MIIDFCVKFVFDDFANWFVSTKFSRQKMFVVFKRLIGFSIVIEHNNCFVSLIEFIRTCFLNFRIEYTWQKKIAYWTIFCLCEKTLNFSIFYLIMSLFLFVYRYFEAILLIWNWFAKSSYSKCCSILTCWLLKKIINCKQFHFDNILMFVKIL